LKKSLSILIILSILLQSFSKVWIAFSFKINQDYIARELCINRDNPDLHCNGNCVLMQRLKNNEEKEQKELPQHLKKLQETWNCPELPQWSMMPSDNGIDRTNATFFYQNPFTACFAVDIFRPPRRMMA
jgi:hypothetical protein